MIEEVGVPDVESGGFPPLSRRTILRTAAHAAWAVPVISVVTAAPAFATSKDILTVESVSQLWNKKTLTITMKVENGATGTLSASPVVLELKVPNFQKANGSSNLDAPPALSPGNGWTLAWFPTTGYMKLEYPASSGSIPNPGFRQFTLVITWSSTTGQGSSFDGTVSATGFDGSNPPKVVTVAIP